VLWWCVCAFEGYFSRTPWSRLLSNFLFSLSFGPSEHPQQKSNDTDDHLTKRTYLLSKKELAIPGNGSWKHHREPKQPPPLICSFPSPKHIATSLYIRPFPTPTPLTKGEKASKQHHLGPYAGGNISGPWGKNSSRWIRTNDL
jgi:hypothetical protein